MDDVIAGRVRVDFPESRAEKILHPNHAVGLSRSNAEPALNGRTAARPARETEAIPLAQLPHHPVQLDADTTIISGGLDWRYKDLRALWALKQTSRFSYCAIIHDLIAIRFPQFVDPDYVVRLTDYFGELIWLADQAMCVSQTTRQDWLQHAYQLGAEPPPSTVFHEGCDLPLDGRDLTGNVSPALHGKQFAIYVSTIEPRKNHRTLYEAWEECIKAEQIDPKRHRLVFVGRAGWGTGDLMHEIETNPLTRETIVFLRDVSDDQLASLYQTCSFVLFPSFYEGFGLPLAEALGYGKLCVSSNTGALSEIGDDLVIRLDPKDTLSWSRTIGRLMSSSSELAHWEERIRKHYRPLAWDDAANSFFNNVTVLEPSRPALARFETRGDAASIDGA